MKKNNVSEDAELERDIIERELALRGTIWELKRLLSSFEKQHDDILNEISKEKFRKTYIFNP